MPFTVGLCAKIQQTLINIAGNENTGYTSRQRVGFLDAIRSPYNREGFQQIDPMNGNGGKRPVEIMYIQPLNPDDVVNGNVNICDATVEIPPLVQTIAPEDFEKFSTPGRLLSEAELRKLCTDDPSGEKYRSEMVMSMINALNVRINRYMLATQQLNWGDFYNLPNTAIAAPILTTADNAIRMSGWVDSVEQSLNDIRVSRKPLIVGGGRIFTFSRLAEWGCCNNAGIDLNAATQNLYYFNDTEASTAGYWGAQVFGAFSPGAVQLVTYNENNEYSNREGDTFVFGNVIDPITGLKYNFSLIFDTCERAWRMGMSIETYLWHTPNDMYAVGDPMNGVNGTLRFTATTA